MGAARRRRIESLEHVEEEGADRLVGEEGGDDGLDRLIDEMADGEPLEREPEPERATGHEFTCRACHLIVSRACLGDETRMLCADCEASRRPARCRTCIACAIPARPAEAS